MNSYKIQRTVLFAGAALTYIYSVCDAAMNFKGDVHPTRKATILSAIFPGAGQLYNKKYWKLPIVYGGLATFAYVIDYNNRGYQRMKTAYEYRTDDNDNTVDEFVGYATDTQIQNTRDSYRRYRDLGIIMTAGFYILQIIDAHVDAYLNRYDVSDDLALEVEPIIGEAPKLSQKNSSVLGNNLYGIGLKLKF